MATPAEPEPSADFADRVDSALQAFWRGETSELEHLVTSAEGGSPPVSELFAGVLGDHARSVVDLRRPTQVADYKIIREIGRGGMGVVYEAEQKEPRRRVALKVLRGLCTDEHHIRLFRREVQTLARLKHPAIATIYEAGRTDEGQHFFTMELIDGVPLNAYARGTGASMSARLALFLQVSDAVNYAHQRGVIHRDLKPSNVLVDAAGSPKILDFGLARVTDVNDTVTTTVTVAGGMFGTLPYMSPEQARGNADEIDVRTDVYSLGVVLYELLTGQLPYRVGTAALHEAVRTICEQPPQRPSTITHGLRGDLETIVLKALEKEPARRYQSAAALADDVRRYLRGESIEARKDSSWYVLRKQLRRHRVAVFAALSIVLGSALAAVVAGAGWRWAAESTARLRDVVAQRDFALTLLPVDQLDELAERYRESGELSLAEQCARLSAVIRSSRPPPSADAPTLQISLHRGAFAQQVGILGLTSLEARCDDDARAHAKLSGPAHCYLIACNPDGSVQLCYPENETTPPPRIDDLVFPSGERRYFGLTDGVGLQAFVLVVSQQPLPPYDHWKSQVGALPWQAAEAESAWRFDGERFELLGGQRGTVRERAGPPQPFAAVCAYLQKAVGVDAMQAIAFPVVPADVPRRETGEPGTE